MINHNNIIFKLLKILISAPGPGYSVEGEIGRLHLTRTVIYAFSDKSQW